MSEPIFERYVDERGNISVRVSQDVIVLMQEEAERIEAEYKRMQTENAKLREYIERKRLLQDFARLVNENTKLRELVRDMWRCISHIGEYDVFYYDMAKDGCGISCTVNGEHCCADKLYDRMRELGIEVD